MGLEVLYRAKKAEGKSVAGRWFEGTKAKRKLKWKPKTKFRELIIKMVKEDVKKWENYLNGKIFPWDAPNYPSEANIISRNLKI